MFKCTKKFHRPLNKNTLYCFFSFKIYSWLPFIPTGQTQSIYRIKENADRVLDLKGKSVYPGFIDVHCHCYSYSMNLRQGDLTSVADAGLDYPAIRLMDSRQQAGSLKMQTYVMGSPTRIPTSRLSWRSDAPGSSALYLHLISPSTSNSHLFTFNHPPIYILNGIFRLKTMFLPILWYCKGFSVERWWM